MRIGFDAKRAFFNRSGLGNYSRDLILALLHYYPENEYCLYTPSLQNSISFLPENNILTVLPPGNPGKLRQAFWRSYSLAERAKKDDLDIFHGLSNELPNAIHRKGIKSVVTIHDLIFMRYPQWYNPFDVVIYKRKFRYGSIRADRIVAISKQTKEDLISFFNIEERKIQVIYQGCNDVFKNRLSEEDKKKVRGKWNLPGEYMLYVGTVEERKNLLNLIKAIHQEGIAIPLVVVGRHTTYAKRVQEYMKNHSLKHIYFLKEVPVTDLPGIYQMAEVFIYPSLFEGFGIPILEALYSGVPVITSKGGCFDEVGGNTSLYVDPLITEEIGAAIKKILADTIMQQKMKEAGYKHAQKFSGEKSAEQLMDIYTNMMNE
jgi:glycosyltransferase involved in cell wall biosynthesis